MNRIFDTECIHLYRNDVIVDNSLNCMYHTCCFNHHTAIFNSREQMNTERPVFARLNKILRILLKLQSNNGEKKKNDERCILLDAPQAVMDFFLVLTILMAKFTLHQAQQHSRSNHHSGFEAFSNDDSSDVRIAGDYPQYLSFCNK
uniref:Uncharacterized protein n=1 Tax=Elaeophora elaphi TaxID=1147741 RepID=A0A158Q857_9BILA